MIVAVGNHVPIRDRVVPDVTADAENTADAAAIDVARLHFAVARIRSVAIEVATVLRVAIRAVPIRRVPVVVVGTAVAVASRVVCPHLLVLVTASDWCVVATLGWRVAFGGAESNDAVIVSRVYL